MFDRKEIGDFAVLVCLNFNNPNYEEDVLECQELVKSAGVSIAGIVGGKRQRPDAALFAGKGKIEEIANLIETTGANVLIFNHSLSPIQERNIEAAVECRVVDRTRLILDIFAQRARSHEGKLQVELAQLTHMSTRLVGAWTHLERQGGVGARGPGETQLETDRRLLSGRVKILKNRLKTVKRQRETQRKSRQRSGVMRVSIVGYTNAGKSTLFNALTRAKIYAADQLFATLDTTSRRLYLNDECSILVSDTVGFIRDLPHSLVAAFRSTLEETIEADVLLHVVDSSSEMRDRQIIEVNKVLAEIGADDIPQLLVMNKIDVRDLEPSIEVDADGYPRVVKVSALTGQGMDLLRSALVSLNGMDLQTMLHPTVEEDDFVMDDLEDFYLPDNDQESDYDVTE